MPRPVPYILIYAPQVKKHLLAIDTKYHSRIREKLQEQLQFEPNVETRNRKPLRQPAILNAEWELRFGPDNRFRVFYEIDHDHHAVNVLAIGEKRRERLFIANEEIE